MSPAWSSLGHGKRGTDARDDLGLGGRRGKDDPDVLSGQGEESVRSVAATEVLPLGPIHRSHLEESGGNLPPQNRVVPHPGDLERLADLAGDTEPQPRSGVPQL